MATLLATELLEQMQHCCAVVCRLVLAASLTATACLHHSVCSQRLSAVSANPEVVASAKATLRREAAEVRGAAVGEAGSCEQEGLVAGSLSHVLLSVRTLAHQHAG